MQIARLSNVPIRDLINILSQLAIRYEIVDIIIDPEESKIIIDPVERIEGDSELTDENIYSLI